MNLPPRQTEALLMIRRFIEANGYSPTIRELAEDMGISTSGAEQHIQALTRKRAIHRVYGSARTITLLDKNQSCTDSLPVENR